MDIANLTPDEEYILTVDGEEIPCLFVDFTADGAYFNEDLFDGEGEWYDYSGFTCYQQDGMWIHGPSTKPITDVRPGL